MAVSTAIRMRPPERATITGPASLEVSMTFSRRLASGGRAAAAAPLRSVVIPGPTYTTESGARSGAGPGRRAGAPDGVAAFTPGPPVP